MDVNAFSAPTNQTNRLRLPVSGAMNPTDSKPPPTDVGDVSATSSENDATNNCDMMYTPSSSDKNIEEENDDGSVKENVMCVFTTNDVTPEHKTPDPETTSSSLPQKSDFDDVYGNAIVRVQQRDVCVTTSEVKGTIMPVADLAKGLPSLAQSKVDAVPLAHHYYNPWARAPRSSEDNDGDVINITRRQVPTRMFTATGSLKFYNLMNAIVRDKQSPISSQADLFQTTFPTSTPSAETAPGSDVNDSTIERSLSEMLVPRNVVTPKSSGSGSERSDSQTFPPIIDSRTRTTLGNEEDPSFSNHQLVSFPPQARLQSNKTSVCSEHLLGSADIEKLRAVTCRMPARKWCQSASYTTVNQSTPALRPPQALSMSTASLLFSSAVDMRDEQYRQVVQRYPRSLFLKAKEQHPEVKEGLRDKDKRNKPCTAGGLDQHRTREVTRVEFVDFTDVRGIADMGKENDARRKAISADIKSARMSTRLFGNLGQRKHSVESSCRNDRHFVTVGLTLPIHASAD